MISVSVVYVLSIDGCDECKSCHIISIFNNKGDAEKIKKRLELIDERVHRFINTYSIQEYEIE